MELDKIRMLNFFKDSDLIGKSPQRLMILDWNLTRNNTNHNWLHTHARTQHADTAVGADTNVDTLTTFQFHVSLSQWLKIYILS